MADGQTLVKLFSINIKGRDIVEECNSRNISHPALGTPEEQRSPNEEGQTSSLGKPSPALFSL